MTKSGPVLRSYSQTPLIQAQPLAQLMQQLGRRPMNGLTLGLAAFGLAACGGSGSGGTGGGDGGGGDGNGGGSGGSIGGTALKGPLSGAFVFADVNNDGDFDPATEPSATTDATGGYTLDSRAEGAPIIVITTANTLDTSTNQLLPGITLRAPAGSDVVSPLTTLVVDSGLSPEAVANALGLPAGTDLLSFNPFAVGADPGLALEVEQSAHLVLGTIRMIAATLEAAGLEPAAALASASAALTAAVGAAATTGGGTAIDFTNPATVGAIFDEAVTVADALPDVTLDTGLLAALSETLTTTIVAVNSGVEQATDLSDASAFSGPSNLVNAIAEAEPADLANGDAFSAVLAGIFDVVVTDAVITFTGTGSGLIDIDVAGNDATFTRNGISETVTGIEGKTIDLAQNQTLSVSYAEYQSLTVTGAGNLRITIEPGELTGDATGFFDGLDAGDIVYLASGEHAFNATLNKPVTVLGANAGDAVHDLTASQTFTEVYATDWVDPATDLAADVQEFVDFDLSATVRTFEESWINGQLTIAASDITLDGLRLHHADGGIAFDASATGNIDDFSLLNSYLTGHAAGSINFTDPDYTVVDGVVEGQSSGWVLSGNLIGGVSTATGNGGSLYLNGLSDSVIEGNVFWRPGAAHLYLEDLTDVTLSNNFFYHGLHAGGADFDGLLAEGGTGYGYGRGGYGYGGEGYGYGDGYGGSGYGYGGGYGGYGDTYYGRNYWLELKGVNEGVTFDSNLGLYNSGGIQIWDEGSSHNTFTNIVITGNVFDAFINADPAGYLDSLDGESRHLSGIMGGIVWSTVDESTSSGLTIDGNRIEGDLSQLLNSFDIRSLIQIQGGVGAVDITNNTLTWNNSAPLGPDQEDIGTAGIFLSRTLVDDPSGLAILISDNSFSHPATELPTGYGSTALVLDFDNAGGAQVDAVVTFVDNLLSDYQAPSTEDPAPDLLNLGFNDGSDMGVVTADATDPNYPLSGYIITF